MDHVLNKAVLVAGCLAVVVALPPDEWFVAALLIAITASALCEAFDGRFRIAVACAYAVAALVFPTLAVTVALVAYECMRDRRTWVRAIWAVPLAAAFPRLPLSAFCVAAVMCAVASLLALRASTIAQERTQYRTLRDGVRERALALENRNRQLVGEVAELREAAGASVGAGAGAESQLPREAYPSLLFANLTERELEIAAHVAKGLDNKEIAGAVFASEGTVRNHISSILQKTGLRNRTQIAIAYLALKGTVPFNALGGELRIG